MSSSKFPIQNTAKQEIRCDHLNKINYFLHVRGHYAKGYNRHQAILTGCYKLTAKSKSWEF